MKKTSLYFDYAATTPLAPEVFESMKPWMTDQFWNPGGVYDGGFRAKEAVEDARKIVAKFLNCKPKEIIFTSGGSESNNLAIRGAMALLPGKHMITSAIEHHSVLHTMEDLARENGELTILPIETDGRVSVDRLKGALKDETGLVSLMMANNEIGTIQPIRAISRVLQVRSKNAVLHVDAVQGVAHLNCDVQVLGADLLSLSGHKFYGPRGVGVLFVREGTLLKPQVTGGGQEGGRRAGTENVAGIVGFAKALQLSSDSREKEELRLKKLRDHLFHRLSTEIKKVRINGSLTERLVNNVHVSFWGTEGESLILLLNEQGICASTGSACASTELGASHVIQALGVDPEWAHGSLRLSLGKGTTQEGVDFAAEVIKESVERLRKLSPLE